MKSILILLALSLGATACETTNEQNISKTNIHDSQTLQEKEAMDVVEKFVVWHNRFFSAGNTENLSIEILSDFFTKDLYFEFNGRPITHNLEGMLKGYKRIKAKDKIIRIEKFSKVEYSFLPDNVIKVFILHDHTSILKDGTNNRKKAEVSFFVAEGKIFKYIETFK